MQITRFSSATLCVVVGLSFGSCGDVDDPININSLTSPLTAYCDIKVVGKGTKKLEGDYLAHVVSCENGGADMEALKVQAVAARTFAYYKLKTAGSIKDGTSDQVYSCGKTPSAKHYQAVKDTAGQVVRYQGKVICSFYVAGAKPSTSTCVAKSSDSDPTYTEKYVTYNDGKSGSGITQSKLGWVSASNLYNRGCMSQNGSHCLSLKKKTYKQILRFYYGSDIEIVTAQGSCVVPPPPPPPPPPAKHPKLSLKVSAVTIPDQDRDLCQLGGSTGIFDWWVGQQTEVRVDVKNEGGAAADNVVLKLWAEEPHLKVARWNIYSGTGSTLDSADGKQALGHDSPGKSFGLELGTISTGKTKRIKLQVNAVQHSFGVPQVDHPDVRAWIANIDGYYKKSGFSDAPTKNVDNHQSFNGGDLRVYFQTDVLDQESCDGLDNDCDGTPDNNCAGGSQPGTDSGVVLPGSDGGFDPPPPATRNSEATLEGSGCSVGGNPPSPGFWGLFLAALLVIRRQRRFSSARRRRLHPSRHR